MAEKKNLRAPSSIAGLVKYDDDEQSLLKIKPIHVIGICIGMVVLEVILFLALPV
jgi:preprotein translocase subunit Sec61beta